MKSVRVWFKKDSTARYISHLDLNRCMLRAIHHSKLPVWYTEGFNPHPFATFSLPLSLGFRGIRESMDIKLTAEIDYSDFASRLNSFLPEGIKIFSVTEPVEKPTVISYADYEIKLSSDTITAEELFNYLQSFIEQDEILVDKKSKSGIKQVDLKENLCRYTTNKADDFVMLKATLPAGSRNNVNPMLYVKALEEYCQNEIFADVTRTEIYDENVEPFN